MFRSHRHPGQEPNSPSLWRRVTARRRVLPQVIVAGAQRCGSTSLYRYLVQHPMIAPSVWKEIHYFDHDHHYRNGLDWYRAHFGLASRLRRRGQDLLAIDATPDYIFRHRAVRRLAADLPGVRVIVLLRNPIERAYSGYQNAFRKGRAQGSFEDELQREKTWIEAHATDGVRNDKGRTAKRAFFSRGVYVEQLQYLFDHVPRERVLVLRSEDMFGAPQDVVDSVFSFLGLASHRLTDAEPRNALNYAPLAPETRCELAARYRPHNAALAELLGRDFEWDLEPQPVT